MKLRIRGETPVDHPLAEDRPNVVGRREGVDIIIRESTLARVHFQLVARQGRWWLEDLKSTAGTYVNDLHARGPTEVKPGDRIQAGAVHLELVP